MCKSSKEINWTVPTEEDLAYLASLPEVEREKLYREHLKKALASGDSQKSVKEIWQEALKFAKSAA